MMLILRLPSLLNRMIQRVLYYESGYRVLSSDLEESKDSKNGNSDLKVNHVPPEILLNMGTLRMEVGKIKEAFESF